MSIEHALPSPSYTHTHTAALCCRYRRLRVFVVAFVAVAKCVW